MIPACRNCILVCLAVLNFRATLTEAFTPCPSLSTVKQLKYTTTFSRRIINSRISGNLHMRSRDSPSALHAFFEGKSNTESATQSVGNINQLFSRCFWISWWFQITLSIISAVILTFANTVRRAGSSQSLWSSGFSFSAIGVLIAFVNCFWTFSSTRLTRRIALKKVEPKKIFGTLRSYAKTTVIISLVGLLVSLIGAEQIVGNLASKVLTSQGSFIPVVSTGGAMNALQALDIFLVQANTNVLVAQFVPLVFSLFLQTQIPIEKSGGLKLSDLQTEKDIAEKPDRQDTPGSTTPV